MYIQRTLEKELNDKILQYNKILILYGARQVGKTTLVNSLLSHLDYKTLSINADESRYIDLLSSRDLRKLEALVSGYEFLFIDEAQRVPDIGINLKILHDHFKKLKIIVTGSASLSLANSISEPLTGRTFTYTLYPVSYLELSDAHNPFELDQLLEERLVYGSYPDIFQMRNQADKKKYLEEITNAYLYKDILEMTNIKHPSKIRDLLRLLAFQVGSEVSYTELGNKLGMSKETIAHYIDLLEQSFVIFRLSGYSRNLRKEITKKDKIFFYDLGVRNAVIDTIRPLKERNDAGQLWENFLLAERRKIIEYSSVSASAYFWRTYTGAELDYVEEKEGIIHGYEFKFNSKKVKKNPSWMNTYPKATFHGVNKENYKDFITKI